MLYKCVFTNHLRDGSNLTGLNLLPPIAAAAAYLQMWPNYPNVIMRLTASHFLFFLVMTSVRLQSSPLII